MCTLAFAICGERLTAEEKEEEKTSYSLRRRNFLPFEEARDYARALGFTRWSQWCAWRSSGDRPLNIPSNPSYQYRNSGWGGCADWLGYVRRVKKYSADPEKAKKGHDAFQRWFAMREEFVSFIQERDPGLEFLYLRTGQQANLLFRSRGDEDSVASTDSNGAKLWLPLQLKSAVFNKRWNPEKFQCRSASKVPEVGIIVLVPEHRVLILGPGEKNVSNHLISALTSQCASVEMAVSSLQTWWRNGQPKTEIEWTDRLSSLSRVVTTEQVNRELRSEFFE